MTTVFDKIAQLRNAKSAAEVELIVVEMFAAIDKDGTGKITCEQYAEFCELQFNHWIQKTEEDKRAEGIAMWEAIRADPSHEKNPANVFSRADTDKDGFVTCLEYTAFLVDWLKIGQ